ncbi:helix-turn-helix domain-containing protein [Luteimonas sp. FCS-9]|uniref:helix-turn-helix domain-containing protein n=1 Tax=Luteimonas sp. FCS-9 TaxID=1547516 RepID=UPI00069C3382|nr:helix-turn-helix domain-containing protein [Luteimonas sp. FCS-9]
MPIDPPHPPPAHPPPAPVLPTAARGIVVERPRIAMHELAPDATGRFERVGDGLLLHLDDGRELRIPHLFDSADPVSCAAPMDAAAASSDGPAPASPPGNDVRARRAATGTAATHAPEAPAMPHDTGCGWRLDARGWNILLPDGRAIELTLAEQQVLRPLARCPGRPVRREALIAGLADDVHTFDPHRLEVLVYRLRRKCRTRTGAELPLRAVRGVGYVLNW